MRSALLAFVGVPTILLVVAACRSILVNESNDVSLATAYSRGQSESGIQRESVLSVGAAAGCRLAHCALNFSSFCAKRSCRACYLCSPWWMGSSNGSRSSAATAALKKPRHTPSNVPVDSAAPTAPCPHARLEAPTLLVVLRGEPFRDPTSLRWLVPGVAAGRPVQQAEDGGQVRRSDLTAANDKLLASERANADASHVLRPELLRLQTAALASVRDNILEVAARIGYAARVVAVVHHRNYAVQQKLLALVRVYLGCAARVVWAPRQVTQLLSTLGVLEAALSASRPPAALLLLRYDLVLLRPLSLPAPSHLPAALLVPTLNYRGTEHEKADDVLHLVPRCRLEDFLRWLALNAHYDMMHHMCQRNLAARLSPVHGMVSGKDYKSSFVLTRNLPPYNSTAVQKPPTDDRLEEATLNITHPCEEPPNEAVRAAEAWGRMSAAQREEVSWAGGAPFELAPAPLGDGDSVSRLWREPTQRIGACLWSSGAVV